MKWYYILLVIIILISCDSESQLDPPGENYFVKFYGEDGNHEGIDFIVNDDGTFILLGNVKVPGLNQQIYMVKVDAQGMVIGEPKAFGANVDHFAKDIEHTPDGNMIVTAESVISAGNRDVYVLKVDNNLNIISEKTVSGILKTPGGQESDEEVNSISVISDGYIVVGSTTAISATASGLTDALHLRFTFNLDLVEQGTLNQPIWAYTTNKNDSEDVLIKMIEINPSTFYGFGYTNTVRNQKRDFKYWAFSLGATGTSTNDGTELLDVIGSPEEDEKLSGVIESPATAGEGYVLSGIRTNSSKESQSFIVKLQKDIFGIDQDNLLAEESPTELGNLENFDENTIIKTSMVALSQGGFLLLTNNKAPTSDEVNISLIKLSNTFKTEGRQQIFFGGAGDDFAGTVKELPDGKIMVMGTMTLGGVSGQKKIVLMKLNKDGKLVE